MPIFYRLLINNLVASVTNFTVWFALTFFVYLETESVFATGMISGIYLTLVAASGFWFGSIVDHHKKKTAMAWSTLASLLLYIGAFALYVLSPSDVFKNVESIELWILSTLLLLGVVAGNIRGVALPTLVTLLVPEDRRDKANGLVGMVNGISFGVVSVISGILVGYSGLYHVLILALILCAITLVDLFFTNIPEKEIIHLENAPKKVDIKGTIIILSAIPGLIALIFFSTFNNFLGGVFMALMDAYGLSLMRVEMWGFLLGILSFSFMAGGILVAKFGLGKNPLRTMLLANIVIWTSCAFFTIQPSIILLAVGMFVYMAVIPFIEAAEHTVIQKVVPVERQGRAFGFAQSVEQLASPLTAFFMGPLAQFFFIPFMTTGLGAAAIGGWFGTGPGRGIALVFTVTGVLGVLVTIAAMRSKPYRDLSARYLVPTASVEA